jgi:hypothetical protein
MRDTGVAVLVLAAVVAFVAWFAGPFAAPRRLRGFFGSGVAAVREAAARHGISTGRTGEWLYAQRALLRAAVAVIAAAIVLLVRPLTTGLVLWTLVGAAVAVALLELLQRPAITVPETAGENRDFEPASANSSVNPLTQNRYSHEQISADLGPRTDR